MKNKITRTIALIVFVVFLGMCIPNVHAKVAKTCFYEYTKSGLFKDKNLIVDIQISANYTATIGDSSDPKGKVKNWNESVAGFKAYDYYIENNYRCPDILVVDEDWYSTNDVYFADTSNTAKKICKEVDIMGGAGSCTYAFKNGEMVNEDAPDEIKDSVENDLKPGNNKITPKTCRCAGDYNGTPISFEFDVDSNLSVPKVTVKYGKSTNKESIQNWSTPYGSTEYTYKVDLSKHNKCPDYGIIARRGFGNSSYWIAVSDSEHVEAIANKAVSKWGWGGLALWRSCEEVEKVVTSNSNSNKTSNTEVFDDPEVVVINPLITELDTYSCGNGYLTGIPEKFPKTGKFIVNFIQVLVPLAIIILGSIDLVKSILGQKEDEIKKGQQVFMKRLISSIMIFFVFAIVKLVISIVAYNSTSIIDCVDCILNDSTNCILE